MTGDKGYDQDEANNRAVIHAVADELNREDLAALANVARLLLLVEREPGLFEAIAEGIRATNDGLKAAREMGQAGQVCGGGVG